PPRPPPLPTRRSSDLRIDAANQLIEDVPPPRNTIELQRLAVSRLGKDVIDIEDASVAFDGHEVLSGVTWRLAPGERTGILGANRSEEHSLNSSHVSIS